MVRIICILFCLVLALPIGGGEAQDTAPRLTLDDVVALDEVERIQRFRAERGDISELELTRIQVQRFAFERDAADARLAIQAAKIMLRALAAPDTLPADFEVLGNVGFRDQVFRREELYR